MSNTVSIGAGAMVVKPGPEDWDLAREVHSLFAAKIGATHIATMFALAHLSALLRQRPSASVLEFGSGIGTITYLLLRRLPRDVRVVCAERNEWCRQQFEANIPRSERDRVNLIPEGRPDLQEAFDLVVIDGPVSHGAAFAREGTLIFVEGTREKTWSSVEADLAALGLACLLTHYPAEGFGIRWRRSRFGITLPRLEKAKGCAIGEVRRIAA
jgi:hypothetical protein